MSIFVHACLRCKRTVTLSYTMAFSLSLLKFCCCFYSEGALEYFLLAIAIFNTVFKNTFELTYHMFKCSNNLQLFPIYS